MYELGLVAHFEAAHHLSGEFGPATRVHGHTYRLEVSVRGERLRPDGTLCDLTLLQGAAQSVLDGLHYRQLDEVPALAGQNTTIEVLAEHVARQMAGPLRGQGLHELQVRLWESPTAFGGASLPLE